MTEFFTAQLDYIFFIYGLAFLLLAAVCFSSRGPIKTVLPWFYLGLFALLHGANEWLDLVALMFGDSPLFANTRLVVMVVSFAMLVEFGRLGFLRLGRRSTGYWIYLPLLAVTLLGGLIGGQKGLNDGGRYAFGLVGCLWTAAAFWFRARALGGGSGRILSRASLFVALYGIAAGAVVPKSPFLLAPWLNHESFFAAAGFPIQLLRAALACAIAGTIWLYEQKRFGESHLSERRARYFQISVFALAVALLLGWGITNSFGKLYEREVWLQVDAETALVAERLKALTAMTSGLAHSVAGSPLHRGGLTSAQVQNLVDRYSQISKGIVVSITDSTGHVITNSERSLRQAGVNLAPHVAEALSGIETTHFAGFAERGPDFYAIAPIRDAAEKIVGTVIIKKSIESSELGLSHFPHAFLVERDGTVLLAGESDPPHALWPNHAFHPDKTLAPAPLHNGSRVQLQGKSFLTGMHTLNEKGWALVVMQRENITLVSRLFGITVALMICCFVLIATVIMQREIAIQIHLHQNHERLQDLSQRLERQAMTDTLTGAANRLKFDEVLTKEYNRAVRYGSPLSLIMYDIDHFKQINDRMGHHAGDMVLTELTKLIGNHIRSSDTLARWGGEEFMIIVPGDSIAEATTMTEKLRHVVEQSTFAGTSSITCSFGVVQLLPGETAESFIQRADSALYDAKLGGRNRVALA